MNCGIICGIIWLDYKVISLNPNTNTKNKFIINFHQMYKMENLNLTAIYKNTCGVGLNFILENI